MANMSVSQGHTGCTSVTKLDGLKYDWFLLKYMCSQCNESHSKSRHSTATSYWIIFHETCNVRITSHEMLSCQDLYCGRAISITYSECVFVVLVIQHAKRIRRSILKSVACLTLPYFTILSDKQHNFRKKRVMELRSVFDSLYRFVSNICHSKNNYA